MYDTVVVGAGHAGCEAALACARMGFETLLLTLNIESIALMPCNPSIGGTGKGHLVREVDALGGEMALAADDVTLQSRMLNTAKGPAVHSLRIQADKRQYHTRMMRALFAEEKLTVRQGEAARIETVSGEVRAVVTLTGDRIECKTVILCTGVYLKSRIIIGETSWNAGPQGLLPANSLSASLEDLGFPLRRFKTGTPARVAENSIDFSRMDVQRGDEPPVPFSFLTDGGVVNRACCYLTWTNEKTHEIIRQNLHRAPMYSGLIHGTGARYCPSIEDKVTRFADKDRHQLFVEPEGLDYPEWYIQGMSTGLPRDVQVSMYRTIRGLERARLVRLAYAIEYDCINANDIKASLEFKKIKGLFSAGQLNGSSGYEEAAAQGLIAGINAVRQIQGKDPVILDRSQAYIGVLIDDLVTKENMEPYRMMTSRAEYRLLLRQDNADLRLSEIGHEVGLISDVQWEKVKKKKETIAAEVARIKEISVGAGVATRELLERYGSAPLNSGATLDELIRRPELDYEKLKELDPEYKDLPEDVIEQINIEIKYEGYIARQQKQVENFRRVEKRKLSEDIEYQKISGLRLEAGQKLDKFKPLSIGQASRISGVTPADIAVLLVYLSKEGL